MYLDFYGLKEKPFNTTPDPKFLYLTPEHQEALAQLLYGVQESKGFLMLTGEVGTGKTTLLHTLLQRLNGKTEVAFVYNSKLPFDGLLEYMLKDFGIENTGRSRAQRLFTLNNFLIERRRKGQDTLLIIDEAQNLAPPVLEQIRMLSNFETPTEKLLQILLVGQPELKTKLNLPELRQLKQRIGLRCTIRPLTGSETVKYIRTRLRLAGAKNPGLFTDRAVMRIAEYTAGIPRLINIVCDHCLLCGYADEKRQINQGLVEQVIEYLEAGERKQPRQRPAGHSQRWVMAALAVILLTGLASLTLGFDALKDVSSLVQSYFLDLTRFVLDLVTIDFFGVMGF